MNYNVNWEKTSEHINFLLLIVVELFILSILYSYKKTQSISAKVGRASIERVLYILYYVNIYYPKSDFIQIDMFIEL